MSSKDGFIHDADARNDHKILELRARFGWSGYGIYWALVEMLRSANDYKLKVDRMKAIALGLGEAEQVIRDVIDCCFEVGLFRQEAGHFFSDSLNRRMNKFEQGKVNRSEGWNKRRKAGHEPPLDSSSHDEVIMKSGSIQCDITLSDKTKNKEQERSLSFLEEGCGEKLLLAPQITVTKRELDGLHEEFGPESIAYYAPVCSDYLKSSGKRKKDYAAFMRNWIRKDIAERKGFYHHQNNSPANAIRDKFGFIPSAKEREEMRAKSEREAFLRETQIELLEAK